MGNVINSDENYRNWLINELRNQDCDELISIIVPMCENELFKTAIDTYKKNHYNVKPTIVEVEGDKNTWWYVCGECHTSVNLKDHFCRECGRTLIWDQGGVL